MFGKRKVIYNNGDIYDGQFWFGEMHGKGIFTTTTGIIYEGEFIQGKRDGSGTITYIDGEKYQGQWRRGKRYGEGTCIFPNGDQYKGEWKQGKIHGKGIYTYSTGEKYEGEWINDRMVFCTKEIDKGKGLIKLQAILNYQNAPSKAGTEAIAVNWLTKRFEDSQNFETDNIFMKTKESLKQATAIEKVDKYLKQKLIKNSLQTPQMILGGSFDHSIVFVLYKENLLICNRAKHSKDDNDGRVQAVIHLKIEGDKAKSDVLDVIKKANDIEVSNKQAKNLIYEELPKIKNISEYNKIFEKFERVAQRTGNCWYTSPHVAVRAIMCLLADEEFKKSNIESDLFKIEKRVNDIYEETISSKNMVKQELKEYISRNKKENDNYNILLDDKLFKLPLPNDKKINKIKNMILELPQF